jgi:hypothetical protein
MRATLTVILLCLALAPLVACRTVIVDTTHDEAAARDPKDPDDIVEVFREHTPERAYKTIGTVRAKVKLSPYRKYTWPDDRVLDKMKAHARNLGADALVDFRVESVRGGGDYLAPDGAFRKGNSQLWIATAVVWIEAD